MYITFGRERECVCLCPVSMEAPLDANIAILKLGRIE